MESYTTATITPYPLSTPTAALPTHIPELSIRNITAKRTENLPPPPSKEQVRKNIRRLAIGLGLLSLVIFIVFCAWSVFQLYRGRKEARKQKTRNKDIEMASGQRNTVTPAAARVNGSTAPLNGKDSDFTEVDIDSPDREEERSGMRVPSSARVNVHGVNFDVVDVSALQHGGQKSSEGWEDRLNALLGR
ncbi:unnamed protein product [Periconia digitata]|uniref:Uncharacterized protein n=1 Tax=Periconia digitata TaxID=1303443 RepID=A0A9W4U0F0_9PLEO|nr:unnamed protein product [Periconia digitata]